MDRNTYAKIIHNQNQTAKTLLNPLKINSIKVATSQNFFSSLTKANNNNKKTNPLYSRPVPLFKLPQIASPQAKKAKVDLVKLNIKSKKYKKDSNSSLSNNSNHLRSDLSKSFHHSDNNYETTTTTEEPKLINKLFILFEVLYHIIIYHLPFHR